MARRMAEKGQAPVVSVPVVDLRSQTDIIACLTLVSPC